MKQIVAALFVVALVLSSPALAAEYYTKHAKSHDVRLEPEEGHAVVYVFRPATVGAAIKTWAFADDDLIMVSKARAYSAVQVPAGTHLFWTKSENTSALELEVEAGKTYYLKVKIKMGINKARAKLIEATEEEAQKYFSKCTYVEATPAGLERAQEIVANRKGRAEKKAEKARKE